MQSHQQPVMREIVLAGGGHTHALLIRRWAMTPMAGVRLTLVSPDPLTPYSGMLPGLIAGHYTHADIHIDLARLSFSAGVRFIRDSVTGIDLSEKRVRLAGRPPLDFDLLSIDTGCTPNLSVPGAKASTVPVKPIAGFWQRWAAVVDALRNGATAPDIAVVGGGAGAVETVLAMAHACANDSLQKSSPGFHLVFQNGHILPGYPARVRRAAEAACRKFGIRLHAGFRVARVEPGQISSSDNRLVSAGHVFWCTQAAAPDWPANSGLACDSDGFIAVNTALQSTGHPDVFAAGDVAAMMDNPRPKAGVYAVRQAPVLFENLRSRLLNQPLLPYRPQDRFLSLLSLGGRHAAGNRGSLAFAGAWVWRWKNRIDRTFMGQFVSLPVMPRAAGPIPAALVPVEDRQEQLDPAQRCNGCGGKVGPVTLSGVLRELDPDWQAQDANELAWPGTTIIQSIDALAAPFDDPYLFGRVVVLHALNDLLARNATPHSIQVSVTLPFAGRAVQQRELRRLLQGVHAACRDENVILVGGHSCEGASVSVSVSANGMPGNLTWAKTGARPGDILAINKPLGTGIMLSAHMHGLARGEDLELALSMMATSNRQAREDLLNVAVHGCTDISGFGLLGHLSEMLVNGQATPALMLDTIPMLRGVEKLVHSGVSSTLLPQNAAFMESVPWAMAMRDDWRWPVLLDPQTGGGLLVSAPADQAGALVQAGFVVIGSLS